MILARRRPRRRHWKHAGVSESQVSGLRVQQDWDDGRLEYEVEFWVDTTEYDYTIAAADGSVLKQGGDPPGAELQRFRHWWLLAPKMWAQNQVRRANTPGISKSQATDVKVKQDWDDGRLECEVEFWVGSTEYDYTIDAVGIRGRL